VNEYYEELRSSLTRDAENAPPPPADWNENERWLFRHLVVVAYLLQEKPQRYRDLLAQWESESPSEELRASALHEAGALGLVLQSVRSRPEVLAGVAETPYKPTLALGALDQLFYSFTLLTSASPEDDYTEARITPDELDGLFLQRPKLREWMAQMGADAPA
jgi:hypothetical protein